jgi:hypothetical protein
MTSPIDQINEFLAEDARIESESEYDEWDLYILNMNKNKNEALRVMAEVLSRPDMDGLDCDCGFYEDEEHVCIRCDALGTLHHVAKILSGEK